MWNVVHTNANHEAQVAKFLALHDVEVYAPRFAAAARTRSGSVRDRRQRWVFPGYLFIRVPARFDRWDLVQWAPGVRRVLSTGGSPDTLVDGVIDQSDAFLISDAELAQGYALICVGRPRSDLRVHA